MTLIVTPSTPPPPPPHFFSLRRQLSTFATPEDAAAERRKRKRRIRIEPPLSSLRQQQQQTQPISKPQNPNTPKLPESVSTLLLRQSKCADLLSLYRFTTQAAIAPNVVSYNLVFQTYLDCRRPDTALEYYKLMIDLSPINPSPTTYRILPPFLSLGNATTTITSHPTTTRLSLGDSPPPKPTPSLNTTAASLSLTAATINTSPLSLHSCFHAATIITLNPPPPPRDSTRLRFR
ncbi:hypothetical protein ACFE04_022294 [Oxalis oulophora]